MSRLTTTLALSALALALCSGIVVAQPTAVPAKPPQAATAPATTGTKADSSKSASKIGSIIILHTIWATRSRMVGIPNGLLPPLALSIHTRFTAEGL